MTGNTVKSYVPIIYDGKYSQISWFYNVWWEIKSNLVILYCMMGNTVKSRSPIIYDGKYSQISFS
jgi:hypothetical protein